MGLAHVPGMRDLEFHMAAKKLQVVLASAEAAPFVKTGGLGDVAGSLPQALVKAGADVIVMVPKYATIPDYYKNQMEHIGEFYVSLGWRNEYCGMERLVLDGVTFLFLDNEHYFARSYPYGFFDDGERFAFFSKAVTEALQHLPEGFTCDVLHCNDWHTAMAPVFLREFYQGLPLYERVRTVFTIHNIAFQGQFSDKMLNDVLGMAHIPAAADQLRCDATSINFMQGALDYSDAITTVSPSYAWEIKTPEYGEGLDGVLRRRENVLSGILNGIDMPSWDPATDYQIPANFHIGDMSGKAACKRALQEELGLEVRDDRPLMVMVTRLTRQKGMDLVTYALDRILSGGVQVAVLGTGDRAYEDSLNYFAAKYPGTMAARITFDSALSRRMYAGADMFLMPSLFEPCGLSQIIAMRYGTLPIVRETGGLRDTVQPYNQYTGEGTGFSFANFNGDEMGDAVFRAARLFWDDRDAWNQVVKQAMEQDFSWKRSAAQYIDLYRSLCPDTEVMPEPEPTPEPEPKAAPAAEPTDEPKPEAKPEPAPKVKPAATSPAAETKTADAAEAPAPKKAAPKRKTAAKASSTAKKPATKASAAAATSRTTKKTAAKTTTAKKPATAAKAPATAKATASKPAAATTEVKAEDKPATAAKSPAKKTARSTKAASTKTASTKATAAKATTAKAPASKSPAVKATASKATLASAKPAPAKTEQPAAPAAEPASKPAAKPAKSVSAAKKRTTRSRAK